MKIKEETMKIMDVGMAIEAMSSKGLTDEGKIFVENLYQCWKEYGTEYHFEDLKDIEKEIARLRKEAARLFFLGYVWGRLNK